MWKDIQGFEGRYQVSDDGVVRSLERQDNLGRPVAERILRPGTTSFGYPKVSLCVNGVPVYRMIHRLVLESFVGPCPEGMECRHLDGNPQNNTLGNLCWGTPEEQAHDKIKHNTINRGERNGSAKLCELDVWLIRNIDAKLTDLADFFDVSFQLISMVKRNKVWKHTVNGDSE